MLVALLAMLTPAMASADVTTVDLVSVKNGKVDEAVYYYENNWLPYREAALERGFIKGFRLLVDTSKRGEERLLLMTTYQDRSQFESRRIRFSALRELPVRASSVCDVRAL